LKNKTLLGIADQKGRLHCIRQALQALPVGNRAIIKRLFGFFKLQADNEHESKMSGEKFSSQEYSLTFQ
jgi:hypothetical protein